MSDWYDYIHKQIPKAALPDFKRWAFGPDFHDGMLLLDVIKAWNARHPKHPVSLVDKRMDTAKKWVRLWDAHIESLVEEIENDG